MSVTQHHTTTLLEVSHFLFSNWASNGFLFINNRNSPWMLFQSVNTTHSHWIASMYVPATVAGVGTCGKLFYLSNMLFGGGLALLTKNLGFNSHLKILNTHNCGWLGTLPMVNLHIVPFVPKIWGHLAKLNAMWHGIPNWGQRLPDRCWVWRAGAVTMSHQTVPCHVHWISLLNIPPAQVLADSSQTVWRSYLGTRWL